jgi:integrase
MPRKRRVYVPKYRRRAKRDTAFVEYRGKRIPLPGKYGSPESRAAYEQFKTDLLAGNLAPEVGAVRLVAHVVADYLNYAKSYYARGGRRGEYQNLTSALSLLVLYCGTTPADQFRARAFEDFMEVLKTHHPRKVDKRKNVTWISKRTLSFGYINWVAARVRRMFRWAVRREIVPSDTHHVLESVPGLRTKPKKKKPVPEAALFAVVAKVNPIVGAMLQFQWYVGPRSGSIVRARPRQFDTSGDEWLWRPPHKQEHTGQELTLPIGPKCQEVLRPFLEGCGPNEFMFNPQRIRNNRRYRRRYRVQTYRQAVSRGIERVNADPETAEPIPRFTPHQLRHSRIRLVREKYGAEAAQGIAGHGSLDATQLYSDARLELAKRAAREMG